MIRHARLKFAILTSTAALLQCETPSTRSSPPPVASTLSRATAAVPPQLPAANSKPELLYLEPSGAPPAAVPPTEAAPTRARTEPSSDSQKRAYAIAVIGDSLSDPKAFGGGYLDYVRARCPKSHIENFAKGGFMVNQMRRRLETQILTSSTEFSHLIVFGGVNDVYSDQSAGRVPSKIQHDLLRMYTAANGRGMKVIAINIGPWGGYKKYFNPVRAEATRTVNSWISAQVTEGIVARSVDAYSLLSCGNAEMLCPEYAAPFKDGLHFGKKGHEVLGKALYEAAFKDCE